MIGSLALPMSALELCHAVRELRAVDSRRLDRVLRHDAQRSLLEVQSGTTWDALAAHPQVAFDCRDLPGATVGEALLENAAGPDGAPFAKHVEAFTLVTADGEMRRLSRAVNPDLFALCIGGHGVFGIVYSVTLRLNSLRASVESAAAPVILRLDEEAPANAAFRLLVPPEGVEIFIGEVRACCQEWHTTIASVAVRRTVAEDETLLRWAVRDYADVALRLGAIRSLGNAVRSTQLRRALIDIAIACGGSFPISCTPDATRAQVERCYPMLPRFMAEKRRLDPAGKLANAWYAHYRSLLGRGTCEVRWGR